MRWRHVESRCDLRQPVDRGGFPTGQHIVELTARDAGKVGQRVQGEPSLLRLLANVPGENAAELRRGHAPTVGADRCCGLRYSGLASPPLGKEFTMRAIVATALVFAVAACDSKTSTDKKDEKKATAGEKKPVVELARLSLLVPGTPATSIKAALDELGPGAEYRSNFHDVVARLDHPWFNSAICNTKGYDHVEDCTFYFRPGVLSPANLDAVLPVIDGLEPSLTSVRRKKIWDQVLGTYTFEWGRSEFSSDVTLYLDWDKAGKEIVKGHLTICFSASEQKFPACARAMQALLAAPVPTLSTKS